MLSMIKRWIYIYKLIKNKEILTILPFINKQKIIIFYSDKINNFSEN